MNRKKIGIVMAALCLVGVLATGGLAQNVSIDLTVGPPPQLPEVIPAPQPGSVWIPGYWYWGGKQFLWVDGVWANAKPGHYWVPARWEQRSTTYHFEPGHWAQEQRYVAAPPVVVTPQVVVSPPPQVVRQEVVVEVRPGYGPGYWYWNGFQYLWIEGLWMSRPGFYGHGWGPHWGPGWGGPHGGPHRWR